MSFDTVRWLVSRYPERVVALWIALAIVAVAVSPNLTNLAAEGQARLLPNDAESAFAADLVRRTWPDQAYEAIAVVGLHRPSGLTSADRDFARRMADAFWPGVDRPREVARVLGPGSQPELAERLISRDGTLQLIAVPLNSSFVSPSSHRAVAWLQERATRVSALPDGLEVIWTGDAVIGRDYMRNVQESLDRAAIATVFLLLAVLLAVYRSLLLAMIPLATIGVALALSRSLLAWMAVAGWEISPLVELFLVVILFGCGTDFCLFLSWRFGEHWNASNPAGAMRATMKRSLEPLLTSAGTVIVGLALMGTTRFKLFSSTGPSVAIGLALTVVASLTLTPALLILLARHRPRSFAGLTAPSTGFWDDLGHRVLAYPVRTWLVTVGILLPVAIVGLRSTFLQDLFSEMNQRTPAVRSMTLVADKFGSGRVAPLTVVMKGDVDFMTSENLALIDDVSRFIANNRKKIVEVRSATQPLGSPQPLEKARIESRLEEVNKGFDRMAKGGAQLRDGLNQGAAKLKTAIQLEKLTGIPLTGAPITDGEARESVASGLRQASSAIFGGKTPQPKTVAKPDEKARPDDPRNQMLRELQTAAEGAAQIAEGAARAHKEVAAILADPVGHHALDRLLITSRDIQEHPELLQSFAVYLSPDKTIAKIDVEQGYRLFSPEALDQVLTLRRRLREFLDERGSNVKLTVAVAGANAGSADVWALTRRDQIQTWIVVPIGVFLVLLVTLRDAWACLNLVATMLLTYAFSLGATHLLFVSILHADGLDWKVPYFLFVLLVAVGVDYNVFLMTRLQEEVRALGLKAGINRAIAQTAGLISSAAAITACSFASFLFSPLASLRQLGFALVVGIVVDALIVRPLLVPIGHWLIHRRHEKKREARNGPPVKGLLARVES
ncbi:MAG: putative superfamily drug exporter [Planctomycetota bacterium]|nr:putative superfamily drug exporter [Planctomycetota bacterium]